MTTNTPKQASKNKSIVAFAPKYDPSKYDQCDGDASCAIRSNLRNLKGTKMECEFLGNDYNATIFENKQATESNFRENVTDASVIHLAMHGIINNEKADLSGLIFSDLSTPSTKKDKSKVDNILHAYEIRNLELAADMVVLSACQTGNGIYQRGEGIMSMGRCFMYAGTRSILMSLWNLNDMAGFHIIQSFYQQLKMGLPKDKALQVAKLTFLDECENSYQTHPVFWSSLSLTGDNTAIQFDSKSKFPWWALLFPFLIIPIFWSVRRKRK